MEISDQLIASLGAFSIRGYDSLNRKLVRTEGILITEGDNKILNKKLDNYQLKWDQEDKFILMRVDKTKKEKRIEYIELLKNYESIYNLVEGASF